MRKASGKICAVVCAVIVIVTAAWATTKLQNVAIQNSTINSTTIGATTASSVKFTTLTGSLYSGNKCVVTDGAGNVIEAAGSCGSVQQYASQPGCTTGSSAGDQCTVTVTWPVPFADTTYNVVCHGINANSPWISLNSTVRSTDHVTVYTTNAWGTVGAVNYVEVDCVAQHP